MRDFFKTLITERAWEAVVAIVGGYIAIKDLEGKSKFCVFMLLLCAIVFSFAITPPLIAYISSQNYFSQTVVDTIKPILMLVTAAASLKLLDLLFIIISKAKEKFPWIN